VGTCLANLQLIELVAVVVVKNESNHRSTYVGGSIHGGALAGLATPAPIEQLLSVGDNLFVNSITTRSARRDIYMPVLATLLMLQNVDSQRTASWVCSEHHHTSYTIDSINRI
jgi:hypothetical protein